MGDCLADGLGKGLTDGLEKDLADGLNIYKKKDKNIKNQISSIYRAEEEKILSLDELERLFISDTAWQADLRSLLTKDFPEFNLDLGERITFFFHQLRCKGIDRREGKECRTHFVNWIYKNLKSAVNGISEPVGPDKRRGAAITATSPRDYGGAF